MWNVTFVVMLRVWIICFSIAIWPNWSGRWLFMLRIWLDHMRGVMICLCHDFVPLPETIGTWFWEVEWLSTWLFGKSEMAYFDNIFHDDPTALIFSLSFSEDLEHIAEKPRSRKNWGLGVADQAGHGGGVCERTWLECFGKEDYVKHDFSLFLVFISSLTDDAEVDSLCFAFWLV